MLQGAALYCMNAFMEPLCEINGWTRMDINFSLGLAALMGQLSMPLAAAIAARISLRLLMCLGALAGGIATIAMGLVSNIILFTFFFIILWVASQFCGGVVGNALMSNWFSHYRGIALGFANSGVSLSGIFLPISALFVINHFGMRTAYATLGIITCLLAPLCWAIVRQSPARLHLHPDGRRHEPRRKTTVPLNVSLRTLFHRPAVWSIGLSYGLALMCASGILSQLKPRFADLGLSGYHAMLIAALASLVGTIVKYVWGWICDRFSPVYASRALLFIAFCAMPLMFLPSATYTLVGFAVLFSIATGGLWVVLPAVVAHYFGSANFLAVYKVIAIFIIIRCLGFPVMGVSHEIAGSYFLADVIFTFALFCAFLSSLFIKPERAAENNVWRHHSKG